MSTFIVFEYINEKMNEHLFLESNIYFGIHHD